MTTTSLENLLNMYKKDMLSVVRLSAASTTSKAVSYTPKDTGAAQESWTPNINKARTENRAGTSGTQNYTLYINRLKIGDSYYLANGQPYMWWLENMSMTRNGKTIINRGQPGHMVRRIKAEWQQIVNKSIRKVRRGS